MHFDAIQGGKADHDGLGAGVDLGLVNSQQPLNLLLCQGGVPAVDQAVYISAFTGAEDHVAVSEEVLRTGHQAAVQQSPGVGGAEPLDQVKV